MELNKLLFTTWQVATMLLSVWSMFELLGNEDYAYFFGSCVMGVICSLIAHEKGLREGWAIIYGYSYGIFALIWYIAEGDILNKKIKDAKNGK